MQGVSLTSQFALDIASVGNLRSGSDAKLNANNQSLRAAAEQFEAMFLQQMLASMRDATMKSDLMSSSQSDFFESLMDQQWAQEMAGAGIGLADQLVQSLTDPAGIEGRPDGIMPPAPGMDIPAPMNRHGQQFFERLDALSEAESASLPASTGQPGSKAEFVDSMLTHARAAASDTGVPAELMVAQAVLETGWGHREIRREDGSSAFNVFGIKANAAWTGDTVDVLTHEYIGDRRVEVSASFKAYDSYQEAFADYANLIAENPRYRGVTSAETASEAISSLLQGGYATDPAYGQKIQALLDQGLVPASGA